MNRWSSFLAIATIAFANCGRTLPTSSSRSCSDVSGVYDVTYASSCSDQYLRQWTLIQSGCNVHTQLLADAPTLTGVAHSGSLHLVMLNGFTTCLYQLEGDAQFDGRTLRGQASGKVSGPCCGDRNELIEFTAVRR
jgi:hypothetical protein